MSGAIVGRFFVRFVVCVLFIFIFGVQILLGKRLIRHERTKSLWTQKHEKALNLIAKLLILAISADMIFFCIIPSISDLPHIMGKEYMMVKGPALSQALTNDVRTKSVRIQDAVTGEVVHVQFCYNQYVYQGDILEVWYLPHTRLGTLKSIMRPPADAKPAKPDC